MRLRHLTTSLGLTCLTLALAAAVMVGVSGCTFSANIATQKEYDPSDGVGTTIEQVSVRNAMLIGDTNDELNLVMTVANNSDEQQTLTVQWESNGARETETVTLEPRHGNPAPRIHETEAGFLNSIGLENKGVERTVTYESPED